MDHLFGIQYSFLIPLLPLLGAMISGFFGAKILKGQSHWPIWLGVGGAAVISFSILYGVLGLAHGSEAELGYSKHWYTWIEAGRFVVDAGFWFDPLTAVMLCVVTGIGFFITVFAAGYMKGEAGYFRFFAYLGLFIFSMTCLVLGNNFVMLYLGWEGVGLCSYLLIGYYYDKPAAREAAKKAFLVNRIGDFGFGLGIMLIFLAFGTVSFFNNPDTHQAGVLDMAHNPALLSAFQLTAMKWIPFLLMLGAFGKSAQFPLYVWLPDAMEGPTPVSALIHAATMVTAGVYMIARCSTLFVGSQAAMLLIACVGAFTAIFAASIALRQFDLKKVFAYSTISQLGYMFLGVGVLAPTAAVFHLVTHAFFKALLFLSSGVVMHAMMGHLDMRKMSGLKKVMPWTNILMLIGCAALAGLPPFSGFFSKDEIIAQTWNSGHHLLWMVAILTAFLTAYYTFRLYFQVFQGPLVVPTEPADGHAHAGHDDAHGGHDDSHAGNASAHPAHGEVAGLEHASTTSDQHASASASAVQTGTAETSGVDEHLASKAHDAGTNHGHGDHGHHNHEPMIMIFPLIILALGAFGAGFLNWPGESLAHFLGHSPSFKWGYELIASTNPDAAPDAAAWGQKDLSEGEPTLVTPAMAVGAIVAISGTLVAYLMHLKNRALAERVAADLQPLTRWIEAKYWVDEFYQAAVVEPLRELGRAFFAIDRYVVDGLVTAISYLPMAPGFLLKLSTQRGYLQGYAVTMILGIAAILFLIFVHF